MNNTTYDVVIVGAGPGGVSTAYALGKAGINTLLVDKKPMNQIGDKVCGDALSPYYYNRAEKEIGLPTPDPHTGALCLELDHTYLLGKNKKSRIIISEGSATVDRLKYGQQLLESLSQFGCISVLSDTTIQDVITDNNAIVGIITRCKGETKTIQAKITIDASGVTGAVRKKIPAQLRGDKFSDHFKSDEIIVAYREIIQTPDPHPYQNGLYLSYEPEIEPVMPGYYWYFSRGTHELNIGCGYMTYEKNKGKNIKQINENVRNRRFPNAKVIKSQGDLIPARLPFPSLVLSGFMLVGDAGGLCNPLTGEGHGPALLSGARAGKIAAHAIKEGVWTEHRLWEYNRYMWKEFGTYNSWGIGVIKFINKWGFKTFDWLMEKKIIREDDIIIMSNQPDADMKLLSRAKKGVYKPRVLLSLKKMMDLVRDIQKYAKKYPEIEKFDEWRDGLNQITKRNV